MPEPSTPDCEHGYRAAGGTYDCPACEPPMPEPSTPRSKRVAVIAKLLAERIVPYDAWWNDTPEDIAEAIIDALDEMPDAA